MDAKIFFDRLWNDYIIQNPEVKQIYDSFLAEGETVENDHIAFRTIYDPHINVDVLARPFLLSGFIAKSADKIFESTDFYKK